MKVSTPQVSASWLRALGRGVKASSGIVVYSATPSVTAAAPEAAERLGVNTATVRMVAFAMGGALATIAILLGVARFPLAAGGGVTLALRGIAAASAGRMRSPARVVAAAVAIAAVQVVGGYFLGGGGEVFCDLVAAGLIVVGWRA